MNRPQQPVTEISVYVSISRGNRKESVVLNTRQMSDTKSRVEFVHQLCDLMDQITQVTDEWASLDSSQPVLGHIDNAMTPGTATPPVSA